MVVKILLVVFWVVLVCSFLGGYQRSDLVNTYMTTWRYNPEGYSDM
jgi:L-alanine-DL-glutamate epimerase-like enolase superfamily enzyme